MDNIIFEKVWADELMIELKITAMSKLIFANQFVYVTDKIIDNIYDNIVNFIQTNLESVYIETGDKNKMSAFSMEINKIGLFGKIRIEVKMEIDDNADRLHQCSFYVDSTIDSLINFLKKFQELFYSEIGTKLTLND